MPVVKTNDLIWEWNDLGELQYSNITGTFRGMRTRCPQQWQSLTASQTQWLNMGDRITWCPLKTYGCLNKEAFSFLLIWCNAKWISGLNSMNKSTYHPLFLCLLWQQLSLFLQHRDHIVANGIPGHSSGMLLHLWRACVVVIGVFGGVLFLSPRLHCCCSAVRHLHPFMRSYSLLPGKNSVLLRLHTSIV